MGLSDSGRPDKYQPSNPETRGVGKAGGSAQPKSVSSLPVNVRPGVTIPKYLRSFGSSQNAPGSIAYVFVVVIPFFLPVTVNLKVTKYSV